MASQPASQPASMPLFGFSSPGPFFGNKVRAFWNLQFLGWAAWLGLRGVSGLANGQSFTFLIPQVISAITGFSLTLILSVCYRALISRRTSATLWRTCHRSAVPRPDRRGGR